MTNQSDEEPVNREAMDIVIDMYGGFKPFNLNQKNHYLKIVEALRAERVRTLESEEVKKLKGALLLSPIIKAGSTFEEFHAQYSAWWREVRFQSLYKFDAALSRAKEGK